MRKLITTKGLGFSAILVASLFFTNVTILSTGHNYRIDAFQVFPASDAQNPGPTLASGDRVSWGYVAAGLVNANGGYVGWNLSDMGAGVKIAVLDTGLNFTSGTCNPTLADLAGRVAACQDFTGEGLFDANGHGTATTSLVAANIDGQGIAGVASRSIIYSGKVCDRNGFCNDNEIAAGINWAVNHQVDIISMSLSGPAGCPPPAPPDALYLAVQQALSSGVVVVESAGNGGQPFDPREMSYSHTTVGCPSSVPGVIAVSSVGELTDRVPTVNGGVQTVNEFRTEISEFSSRGPEVDIAGPGKDILSNYRGSLALLSGTSFSAPITAGIIALVMTRYGEYANVASRLPQIAINEFSFKGGTDAFYGHGLVSAVDALTPRGDANGDLVVNQADMDIVGAAFGSMRGGPRYKPAADQNYDGVVDVLDLATVGSNWGRQLVTRGTSVWDNHYIRYAGIQTRRIFDGKETRYAHSNAPDNVTFSISYSNPDATTYFPSIRHLYLTTINPDTGLCTSICTYDLLSRPPVTVSSNGTLFYQLRLQVYTTSTAIVDMTGWKVTISSSSLGYSNETPVFVGINTQ